MVNLPGVVFPFHDDRPPASLVINMVRVERGDGGVAMCLHIDVLRIPWKWGPRRALCPLLFFQLKGGLKGAGDLGPRFQSLRDSGC